MSEAESDGVELSPPRVSPKGLYIHDMTQVLRTNVNRLEHSRARSMPPPSETVQRELWHARRALENAEQLHGIRFDRVLAGHEKL